MRTLRQTGLSLAAGIFMLVFGWTGGAGASHIHAHHGRHAALRHASYSRRHGRRSLHRHTVSRGQLVMDPQRATEIQQALIQARYLNGSPTGEWDADTQAAMVKYQTDNGWQSKITPDSRALIKLGLGPKQDEGEYSASTPAPAPGGTPVSELSAPVSNPNRPAIAADLPSAQN